MHGHMPVAPDQWRRLNAPRGRLVQEGRRLIATRSEAERAGSELNPRSGPGLLVVLFPSRVPHSPSGRLRHRACTGRVEENRRPRERLWLPGSPARQPGWITPADARLRCVSRVTEQWKRPRSLLCRADSCVRTVRLPAISSSVVVPKSGIPWISRRSGLRNHKPHWKTMPCQCPYRFGRSQGGQSQHGELPNRDTSACAQRF
jgi:hypothetical protein